MTYFSIEAEGSLKNVGCHFDDQHNLTRTTSEARDLLFHVKTPDFISSYLFGAELGR